MRPAKWAASATAMPSKVAPTPLSHSPVAIETPKGASQSVAVPKASGKNRLA